MHITQARAQILRYINSPTEKMPLQRVRHLNGKMYVATIDLKAFATKHLDEIAHTYRINRRLHQDKPWHRPVWDASLSIAIVFDKYAEKFDSRIEQEVKTTGTKKTA